MLRPSCSACDLYAKARPHHRCVYGLNPASPNQPEQGTSSSASEQKSTIVRLALSSTAGGASSSAPKRKSTVEGDPLPPTKKRQADPRPHRPCSPAVQSESEENEPAVSPVDDTNEEPDDGDKMPVVSQTDNLNLFRTFLRTLHPSFDFSTRAHVFAHPNIELSTVEQLKSVASSPTQLHGLLEELGKEIVLEDGRKEAGMPTVWRTALGELLEDKIKNGW
ncbi:hypothetical protein JCM5296_005034 [Sporobolomyces johnsonii]